MSATLDLHVVPLSRPVLYENAWIPVAELLGRALDAREIDAWRSAITEEGARLRAALRMRYEPLERRGEGTRLEVRAAGIAGTFSLNGVTFDIAPKLVPRGADPSTWHASVLNMLSRARRDNYTYARAAGLRARPNSFVDHMALAYLDALDRGLATEPIHTYVTREEQLPVLRGRLNVSRQLTTLTRRPGVLECDVDQLDTNNAYNRLLHWACERFSVICVDDDVRRRLGRTKARLPSISLLSQRPERVTSRPPRQYRTWTSALEIASTLATGLAHTPEYGLLAGYAYLLGMERLFERFVGQTLIDVIPRLLGVNLEVKTQDRVPYAIPTQGSRRFYTQPDDVIYQDGEPVLVADAKYKSMADADVDDQSDVRLKKPNNADVYQLVASMTAHNCSRGVLIYPRLAGDVDVGDGAVRTWIVNSFERELRVSAFAIDLTGLESLDAVESLDRHVAEQIKFLLPLNSGASIASE